MTRRTFTRYYSPLQLEAIFGIRAVTWRRWVARRRVKAIKVGARIRVPAAEVSRIMAQEAAREARPETRRTP